MSETQESAAAAAQVEVADSEQAEVVVGDNENVEEVEATPAQSRDTLLASLLNHPLVMSAVQQKLSGHIGDSSGYIESLPKCIRGRVNALKNIQVECATIEGKFYEEAHELEMRYAQLFKPLYEKRSKIVNAEVEPTEPETEWKEPGEDEEEEEEEEEVEDEKKEEEAESELAKALKKAAEEIKPDYDEDTKGIPCFWYTAMANSELLQEMIQDDDVPILKHLKDMQLIFTSREHHSPAEADAEGQMGFVLQFDFTPNEYFSNEALTKTYIMKSEPDEDDPFSFDGPNIVACTGCKIDWAKGKNVTVKTVKKKQKHKGKGQTRVVSTTVKSDSFFNFFEPPEVPDEDSAEAEDEDLQTLLEADFEIGHFFREQLIPKAVLYFTGEAIEEDSDDDEDDDDAYEDDDDNDNYDSDADPDFKPAAGEGDKPENCQQQ